MTGQTDDGCRRCGPHWPAISDRLGLCLLCTETAFANLQVLLDLVDTDEDLADMAVRVEWVRCVQQAATHLDQAINPPQQEVAA